VEDVDGTGDQVHGLDMDRETWKNMWPSSQRERRQWKTMNFLFAIIIGVVIGLIGGFALKSKQANAIWLAPVLATGGALIASVLATLLGDPRDYGPKEIGLQVVLALVGIGVVFFLANRKSAEQATAAAE
jgi:uncharacterized membrane protein YeaQ/YmgE (transglycosylase-associated protein family)